MATVVRTPEGAGRLTAGLRVCLMVEGQEGVSWEQWRALAKACEEARLDALFRSDHYVSVQDHPERDALDAWATLAGLAQATSRIRLGTLVSPATFRHPSVLAKMVVTVDHISGGRVEVGVGAGWHEIEHRALGFPFPPTDERLELLEEQIEILHESWHEGPFELRGRHYTLEPFDARPKPRQRPHPNLIVGGAGKRQSVALAARWADEYNTVFASPETCRKRRRNVAEAWERAERDPETMVFSLMTGCVVGRDREELRRRTRAAMARRGGGEGTGDGSGDDAAEAWLAKTGPEWVVGTVEEVTGQLQAFAEAGVQRVMLQHQSHDDVEMVHLLGEVAAALRGSG